MRRIRVLAGLVLGALVISACSSPSTPLAIMASSAGTIGTGDQRVLIALVDVATNEFLAAGDREATVILRDEDGTPLGTYDLEFVWTLPDVRGVYSARLEIPAAGVYQITVTAEGLNESGPTGFVAVEDPVVITPGDVAPPSETRTIANFPDLSIISSDPDPDPELYRLSVSEAVTNGTPSVIVFATPAFCTSQACGPMLDQVKALRGDYPDVDFVHVEIYEDLQVDSREDLTVVESVVDWGLPSEPWVYVVDESGTVVSAFEGAMTDTELIDALAVFETG